MQFHKFNNCACHHELVICGYFIGLLSKRHTVPLNYNFTFTRVSMRGTMRGSRGKCQSYCGKLCFHVTGRGFSTRRLVAFHDTWHFHETTHGISTRQVVEFPRDQLAWNLSWNFHETSS